MAVRTMSTVQPTGVNPTTGLEVSASQAVVSIRATTTSFQRAASRDRVRFAWVGLGSADRHEGEQQGAEGLKMS